MLPGISSEDGLFADLGVHPVSYGRQSYEATDFLANGRKTDPTSSVVLWQIGSWATRRSRPQATTSRAGGSAT
jgi:hypothetical protein